MMIRKVMPLILLLFMTQISSVSAATIIERWGVPSGDLQRASDGWRLYYTTSEVDSFKNSDGTVKSLEGSSYMYFNCNGVRTVTFYKNGATVGYLKVEITDMSKPCTDNNDDNDNGSGGNNGSCSSCDIMSCPGWSDYMGKLDDIKNAIPPAPNWSQVADTFRDKIAPQIKQDLSDLLGKAPNPPSAPSKPNKPNMPSGLDDGGLKAPTGNDVPSFNFDENDIKNGAQKIPEREDPTGGGFDILDPIGGLPSQDDFKNNIPKEGNVAIPKPPEELENPVPVPPEKENIAPKPEEQENVAPKPNEGSNVAPKPDEGSNIAPKPEEQENIAPKPNESDNVAPKPEEQENVAPKPNEGNNIAPTPGKGENSPIPLPGKQENDRPPIPGGGNSSYPVPGDQLGNPPIPNESGRPPIPKNDDSKAPIPKGG